jgi:hypothetical protein
MARPLAFQIVNKPVSDTAHRAFGRFICRECPDYLDIPLMSPPNPEKMCNFAKQRGWLANVHKPTLVFCPKCQGPQEKKAENALLDLPRNTPDPKVIEMTIKPVEVRQPTSDERVRIRNFLDKSFDDAAGCYLDDMTDARIAELVGVPRVIVERLRETAYGPLLLTPEMVSLRTEMATLKQEHDKIGARIAEVSSRLEQMIAARKAA